MKVSDFDYNLPEKLIAQTPLTDRSSSRLLVLNKENGEREHKHFYNIVDYLNEGDVLVLNDTKVLPSRIYGEKVDTKAYIEVLFLNEITVPTCTLLAGLTSDFQMFGAVSFNNRTSI